MKVLVTGSTGFIGGHIAKAAYEAGWQARGLRRNPNSTGHLGELDIDWITGNLDDIESLKRAMSGVEVVFHAAAYYPTREKRLSLGDNIEYARQQIDRVIQAASQAGIARLIYTSSLSTIGFPPPGSNRLADENDYFRPGDLKGSAYYESKYFMESALLDAASAGFPAVILNPTAVFGPGDVHLTLGRLLLAAANGRMIAWLPGVVNVVDVRDVAKAHIQAVEHGVVGERYIIGGHNLSLKEAMFLVSRIIGCKPPGFGVPIGLVNLFIYLDRLIPGVNLTGNHLAALVRWRGFDSSKAAQSLGLTSRPFSESIKDALHWFIQQGYLPSSAQ